MGTIEALRTAEDGYAYLDQGGHVYLDHTGAGLPARAQLRAHADRVTSGCYGNPHTGSPASQASGTLVTAARQRVLEHFRADPAEYAVVFTANATGACRLVGEAYPFRPGSRLVLTLDNHNSVNGLREYARGRGAQTVYVPLRAPRLGIDEAAMRAVLGEGAGLLAYPAQSNFSGVQHGLDWIAAAKDAGWDVLLDAAAFVPANPLDLGAVRPDFVAVSWYKVFGYPTGVGCLVARREALARLRRPWFSGGTIHMASAQGQWHRMAEGEAAFEDGTVNYLSIPDIVTGLDWIRDAAGGVEAVHRHVTALTARLLTGLAELRHTGGAPLVRVYGPPDTVGRGGTVALNLLDPDGGVIDERAVARDSAAHSISLRTGCFCNPGTGEAAFAIDRGTLGAAVSGTAAAGGTIDDYLGRLGLPSGGAVRVSLGLSSSRADVAAFLSFVVETYRDRAADTAGLAPRTAC